MGSAGIFFIVLICLFIVIGVGIKFGDIAGQKGYNRTDWITASIFLGLPVWLAVIALPNKIQHEELLGELQQIQTIMNWNNVRITTTPTVTAELPDL